MHPARFYALRKVGKIVFPVLPAAVLLALLAGCGSSGPKNTAPAPTTPTASPAPSGGAGGSTTTLQAETANNTSASDTFTPQLNGLPKPANVSKADTRTLLYSGATTKIYAALMGWFGESGHMNVGYNSNDPAQVKRQVEDMQSRGIQGAILDWFGQSDAVINGAAQALRTQAEAHSGFQFAIMEDGGALFNAAKANSCDVTTQLLNDLNYINANFVPSSAYLRLNGRPAIFFFGVDAFYIDWNQVRSKAANNPVFLFRGSDGLTRANSDGGFQWEDMNADPFHPATPNPFDPALAAQDAFYKTSVSGRQAIGSVYRGFNDALAPWGLDRFVQPRCGETWLDTFREIGKFYSANNQLAALQIVTWNDYDEGTAMEMGIDNCVLVQPSVAGSTLSWTIGGGAEDTIDHYKVYSSTDGQNLTKLADVATGTHTLDLSPFKLTSGTFKLYVKATGRPSIQNKMSPAVSYHAGDQPPAAKLALSQTGTLSISASTAGSSDPDGSVASTSIDFGDGTAAAAGPSASHTYASAGSYDVVATVVDNAGASSVVIQRVSAKAAAPGVTILSPTPGQAVNWPSPSFTATAESANPIAKMSVLVDGVQVYATDQDVVNTALKIYAGNHQVQVQASDTAGAALNASVNVTAEPGDVAPTPAMQVTPLPQVGPTTVLLCGANWQDPSRFVNAYQWTFSDGSPPAFVPGVVHTFPTTGSFTATETVINEFGSQGSLTQSVPVSGSLAAPASAAQHVQTEQTQNQSMPLRLPRLPPR